MHTLVGMDGVVAVDRALEDQASGADGLIVRACDHRQFYAPRTAEDERVEGTDSVSTGGLSAALSLSCQRREGLAGWQLTLLVRKARRQLAVL